MKVIITIINITCKSQKHVTLYIKSYIAVFILQTIFKLQAMDVTNLVYL